MMDCSRGPDDSCSTPNSIGTLMARLDLTGVPNQYSPLPSDLGRIARKNQISCYPRRSPKQQLVPTPSVDDTAASMSTNSFSLLEFSLSSRDEALEAARQLRRRCASGGAAGAGFCAIRPSSSPQVGPNWNSGSPSVSSITGRSFARPTPYPTPRASLFLSSTRRVGSLRVESQNPKSVGRQTSASLTSNSRVRRSSWTGTSSQHTVSAMDLIQNEAFGTSHQLDVALLSAVLRDVSMTTKDPIHWAESALATSQPSQQISFRESVSQSKAGTVSTTSAVTATSSWNTTALTTTATIAADAALPSTTSGRSPSRERRRARVVTFGACPSRLSISPTSPSDADKPPRPVGVLHNPRPRHARLSTSHHTLQLQQPRKHQKQPELHVGESAHAGSGNPVGELNSEWSTPNRNASRGTSKSAFQVPIKPGGSMPFWDDGSKLGASDGGTGLVLGRPGSASLSSLGGATALPSQSGGISSLTPPAAVGGRRVNAPQVLNLASCGVSSSPSGKSALGGPTLESTSFNFAEENSDSVPAGDEAVKHQHEALAAERVTCVHQTQPSTSVDGAVQVALGQAWADAARMTGWRRSGEGSAAAPPVGSIDSAPSVGRNFVAVSGSKADAALVSLHEGVVNGTASLKSGDAGGEDDDDGRELSFMFVRTLSFAGPEKPGGAQHRPNFMPYIC